MPPRAASPPPGCSTRWRRAEIVPAALVLNAVNPIMVQGAALADMTLISGFDEDITQAIANGADVEIEPGGDRPLIRVT